jgi:hypothetical protein
MILKTEGFDAPNSSRKGYKVTVPSGDSYSLFPSGTSGYINDGVKYATLKEFKAEIISGAFEGGEATEVSTAEGADTWDTCHPCALLIVADEVLRMKTLEAYGWLDVMGRPDIARAEREIKRAERLSNDSS